MFISMRIAASWAQPLQLRCAPRGARMALRLFSLLSVMCPSWLGGNAGDKQGGRLLGSAAVCLAPVRRVSVVGTSGAGKSTLARALAGALGADFLELDSVYHQAGWVPLPDEEYRARVARVVAGERWVVDEQRRGVFVVVALGALFLEALLPERRRMPIPAMAR